MATLLLKMNSFILIQMIIIKSLDDHDSTTAPFENLLGMIWVTIHLVIQIVAKQKTYHKQIILQTQDKFWDFFSDQINIVSKWFIVLNKRNIYKKMILNLQNDFHDS